MVWKSENITVIDPAKCEEEHHKIVTAYQPKQDTKCTEAAGGDNKILGKQKANFDQGVKTDVVMDDENKR